MGTPIITLEAIVFGLAMGLRLIAVISALSIFTLTIHPDDMMLIMIKLRLPYKSVLVTSLASRFMPTLFNDLQRISDVQRSRGIELDRSGLVQKVKALMTVLIPLLSNSLDRSVQVAEAMEAKAFGGGAKRSYYRNIVMTRFDSLALLLALTPCVIGVVMLVRGWGQYSYYPTLDPVAMTALEWGALALLAVLLGLIVPLAFLKRAVDLD
jgi:energy-coupling factor transport system permease protein